MHDHQQDDIDLNLLEEMGYEHRDIDFERITKGVAWFFFISLIIMFTGVLAMKLVAPPDLAGIKPPADKTKARPRMPGPDVPLIQSNATATQDQIEFVKSQREALTTYGWTDRKSGYVRMPVEDALKKVVSEGLPTRPNPATPEETQ